MIGNLSATLINLLKNSLPDLLGGDMPAVAVSLSSDLFIMDPNTIDAAASAPRADDRLDQIAIESASPLGPYELTQPPYPGPRRVKLVTAENDAVPLRQDEVQWDPHNSQSFHLQLRANRNIEDYASIQVLYGVTAVFTKYKINQTMQLNLSSSDDEKLLQAEALVTAVIALNQTALIEQSSGGYEDGHYSTQLEINSLQLEKGHITDSGEVVLTLNSEIEIKASRRLREDEGTPIERVISPTTPDTSTLPVDIDIEIDA